MDQSSEGDSKKSHRERRAGRKAERKKAKNKHVQDLTAQQRNPKAFAFNSIVKTQRQVARTEDIKSKKHHIPVVNRAPLEPPPILVAIVGGFKVGKTTLMRSLIKHYTRQRLATIEGPVTVVAGKKHRLTFVEVKNDVNCMVDIAKVADVVLMLVDITIGLEMEVFEFLEICRAYGTPRIMGVLNHLDMMKNNKGLRKRKKELIHRFQVELYPGAKLFYLTGLLHGEYFKREVSNLGRFISVLKFRPLQFRSTHPYVLVDRMEDITNMETIRQNPVCTRNVVLYGYVRGLAMQAGQHVHIPGVGDVRIKEISILDDPCPLPGKLKKRSLNSKERLLYAPMSGVAGVVYDKDAIYIELGGSHHGRNRPSAIEEGEDDEEEDTTKEDKKLMTSLLQMKKTADEKTKESHFRLFSHSVPVSNLDDDEESDNENTDGGRDPQEEAKPKFEAVLDKDGRMRRRVVFEDERTESGIETDEDEEEEYYEEEEYDPYEDEGEEEWDDENEEYHRRKKLRLEDSQQGNKGSFLEGETENGGSSLSAAEFRTSSLPGLEKAITISAKSYISFLQNSIYGEGFDQGTSPPDEAVENSEDEDALFHRTSRFHAKKSSNLPGGLDSNGEDSCRRSLKVIRDWSYAETMEAIRDCFVTGEWSEKEDAEKLLKLDDEDEDLYGDFEDLETGKKVQAKKEEAKEREDTETDKVEEKKKLKSEMTAQEKRLEKKRRLKEFFNSEYDDKGAEDYFDALKAEMNEQSELNRTQFEGLDDETRVKYEGFRAGLYVRMEFEGMDNELVTNFDPAYPLIVGGLLDNELSMGYVKVRLKVHRWFPRILKNRDPLYISLGWRRFQSMVFYAKREDNFRIRSLKYARKYLHVEALFWGPVTETSSGFVAFQNVNEKTPDFSIAANGVVLEADQSTTIVKKLKLIGYPQKIYQKTAFIKDMFHSDTEVTKFEGVKIRTQSSIRGAIKKASGPDGAFRATFEDIIKMSDTVILTTWVPIEVPKYCSIVKNLLLPAGHKSEWPGMKTNAQIKRERNIKNLPNPDSLYTEITERREYVHRPLKIPKALQKALPYKFKPKIKPSTKKPQRVVVVKDPEEIKMEQFMSQLKHMMKDKMIKKRQEKEKHQKQYKKDLRAKEELRKARAKKSKSFSCRKRSIKQTKK